MPLPTNLAERVIENVIHGMPQRDDEATWEEYEDKAKDIIRAWDNIELLEAITFALENP